MLALIIWGTRGLTKVAGKGNFLCPVCGVRQPYRRMVVRQYFTLYFIPLFPTQTLAEYVHCEGCRQDFRPAVLHSQVEESAAPVEPALREAFVEMLAFIVCSGEGNAHSKLRAAVSVAGAEPGLGVTDSDLLAACQRLRSGYGDPIGQLRRIARALDDAGKERFLRAALLLTPDDRSREREWPCIQTIASSLDVSPAHLKGILQVLREPG